MHFDFAVVDEAQDITVSHLRFLAALGGGRPNALFLCGRSRATFFSSPFRGNRLALNGSAVRCGKL